MFDSNTVRLLMKAAVEAERHGQPAADTKLALNAQLCCGDCGDELITEALDTAV